MNPKLPNFVVKDIALEEIRVKKYDLAIFASGYEQRCTQGILTLDPSKFRACLIIGFEKPVIDELRAENDRVFIQRTGVKPTIESSELPTTLANRLAEAVVSAQKEGRTPNILVDYSSMHREWYGFILTFLSHSTHVNSNLTIDFLYSFGDYPPDYETSIENAILESIAPLAGMEGLSASRANSIAVFGLGFSPIAGLGALERLQPDKVFCFMASPGIADEYINIARLCNEPLIKRSSNEVLELPLGSLSDAYRGLSELTWPFVDKYHINILPMGPKPHILASMLVSHTYRSVGCLYGKVRHPKGANIPGDGRFSIGSVVLTR